MRKSELLDKLQGFTRENTSVKVQLVTSKRETKFPSKPPGGTEFDEVCKAEKSVFFNTTN